MRTDKAFTDSMDPNSLKVATLGRGMVEHRSFLQLSFTHYFGNG